MPELPSSGIVCRCQRCPIEACRARELCWRYRTNERYLTVPGGPETTLRVRILGSHSINTSFNAMHAEIVEANWKLPQCEADDQLGARNSSRYVQLDLTLSRSHGEWHWSSRGADSRAPWLLLLGGISSSTLRRLASRLTSSMTGRAPLPVPTTNRRHFHGIFSNISEVGLLQR